MQWLYMEEVKGNCYNYVYKYKFSEQKNKRKISYNYENLIIIHLLRGNQKDSSKVLISSLFLFSSFFVAFLYSFTKVFEAFTLTVLIS